MGIHKIILSVLHVGTITSGHFPYKIISIFNSLRKIDWIQKFKLIFIELSVNLRLTRN